MIKVILVDNHELVRSGVIKLLNEHPDIEVVGETESGRKAYKLYNKLKADVLIMDINMSDTSALAILTRIIAKDRHARVVMFSLEDEVTFAAQAISAGAKGYVLKSGKSSDLITGIRQVAMGKTFLSSDIAQKIALHNISQTDNPTLNLTTREYEVFRLLAEGYDIEHIAKQLDIGHKTVANYQSQLKHKLKITNPIQLVRLALKHRVIKLT